MKHGSDYEFRILIGGRKPIQEYEHQGRVFVEGRRGTEFELEFKNLTSKRLLVVPSVDGLSTLDGKLATADSLGYLVKPHATLTIPGWTVNGQSAAKFVFQDKERSYATQTSRDGGTNAGVVGVLVFGEKESILPRDVFSARYGSTQDYPVAYPQPIRANSVSGSVGSDMTHSPTPPSDVAKVHSGTYYTRNMTSDATGVWQSNNTASVQGAATLSAAPEEKPFGLGTGWGQKIEFKTNQTTFNKGAMVAQMALFYDTRRNLEKRGIEVVKRERTYLDELPSPFQGVGCKPPPGWKG